MSKSDLEFLPTASEVAQMVSALSDSLQVIQERMNGGPRPNQDQLDCNREIKRNVRHLEIMLDRDFIQSSGIDLSPFQSVIVSGKAYIESNGGAPDPID